MFPLFNEKDQRNDPSRFFSQATGLDRTLSSVDLTKKREMEFRSIPADGSCGGTCNYLANSLTANHIRGVTFDDSSGSQLFKTLSNFSNSLFQNVPEPTQHLQSDQVTFVQAAHLTAFLKYLCGRRTLLLSFHVIRIPLPPDCSAYCDAKFSPFCR